MIIALMFFQEEKHDKLPFLPLILFYYYLH